MSTNNEQQSKSITVAKEIPTESDIELQPETIQLPPFEKFTVAKQEENILGPIVGVIIFLLPVLVAFRLCDWRVVSSFLMSIVTVPIFFIGLSELYRVYTLGQPFKWHDVGAISGIFILCSIPVYFILVLPLYHLLKTFSFPIIFSFPLLISAIAFSVFFMMVTKPWGIKEVALIGFCSLFHSTVILFGIALLKKLFP